MIRNISIAKPFIGEEEKKAVLAVLDSGYLVQGKPVEEFEHAFASYHGARFGIAMSNGTTALMSIMLAHGIKPGDEVIIPSFTFFATASSVLSVGASVVFADIDPDTYCLSPEAALAAITPRTVAIMPVHLYGHPADMSRFETLCSDHGLLLLEDAAQAHGAAIADRRVGTWGTAAFSFYPSKNMTTGEGGIVLTDDEATARKLRMIRNQGMDQQYCHEIVGFNFRMTNIAAAIGLAQLNRLPEWTAQRIANARDFDQRLTSVGAPSVTPGCTHVYHQYTVRVSGDTRRDQAVKQLNEQGIGVRIYYPTPIHQQPVIQRLNGHKPYELAETERAAREVFSLPVHPALSQDDRDYIVEKVNALC